MSGVVNVLHLSERDGTDRLYHKDEIVQMVSAVFGAWHEGRIKHNVSTETAAKRAIAQGIAEREANKLSDKIVRMDMKMADMHNKIVERTEYARHCITTMDAAADILEKGGWGAKKKALALLKGEGESTE
jgi:hypothetical protein